MSAAQAPQGNAWKPAKVTSRSRPAARAPTRPRSAPGNAMPGRARRAAGASSTRISAGLSSRSSVVARSPFSRLDERPLDVAAEVRGQRLAREVPDHGPELVVDVEGQAVVDDPDVVVRVEQAVPGLAVGVVGDHVEEGDPAARSSRCVDLLAQEVTAVRFDEQLHGARRRAVRCSRTTVGGMRGQPRTLLSS